MNLLTLDAKLSLCWRSWSQSVCMATAILKDCSFLAPYSWTLIQRGYHWLSSHHYVCQVLLLLDWEIISRSRSQLRVSPHDAFALANRRNFLLKGVCIWCLPLCILLDFICTCDWKCTYKCKGGGGALKTFEIKSSFWVLRRHTTEVATPRHVMATRKHSRYAQSTMRYTCMSTDAIQHEPHPVH